MLPAYSTLPLTSVIGKRWFVFARVENPFKTSLTTHAMNAWKDTNFRSITCRNFENFPAKFNHSPTGRLIISNSFDDDWPRTHTEKCQLGTRPLRSSVYTTLLFFPFCCMLSFLPPLLHQYLRVQRWINCIRFKEREWEVFLISADEFILETHTTMATNHNNICFFCVAF